MLELIFADRHELGAVEEDVGSHQNWVVENTDVTGVLALGLFLVLNHAGSFAHGGSAV